MNAAGLQDWFRFMYFRLSSTDRSGRMYARHSARPPWLTDGKDVGFVNDFDSAMLKHLSAAEHAVWATAVVDGELDCCAPC